MLKRFGPDGMFLDLKELVQENAPNLCKALDEMDAWSNVLDPETGAMYSVPELNSALSARMHPKMFFNKKMLEAVGGGRPDHFLANLQTMARYAKQGARICLTDPSYDVFALHNETMELPLRPCNTLVSVFCHGNEARGITLEGLQYPLHDASLTCDIPLGVSNHYAADHPRISVREGTLLVIVYQDQQ